MVSFGSVFVDETEITCASPDSRIGLARLLALPAIILKKSALALVLQDHLRRHAIELLDVMGKMTLVGKAGLMSNFTDGELMRL